VAPSYAYAKKGYDTLRAIVDRIDEERDAVQGVA